jgi:head-tail adaptor
MPGRDGWISAGQLRHTVSVQARTEDRDTGPGETKHGTWVETYAEAASRRAMIERLSGRELVEAHQVHADVTYKVTMRYYALDTSHLLEWTDPHDSVTRTLEVVHVDQVEHRGHKTVALCKERQSA